MLRYALTLVLALALPSPVALQHDATLLLRTYQALHPGLYRYETPTQLDASYALLRKTLSKAKTLKSAFVAFTHFTAQVECGHSYPNFYNQPADVASQVLRGRNRVPFFFEWIDRRMIVTKNFSSDPRIAAGSEIVSINGIPAQQILRALLPLARADGSNDGKRLAELGVRGADQYEAFDVYFPLVFTNIGRRFALTVKPYEGKAFQTTVDALDDRERSAETPLPPGHNGPLWSFRMIDAKTGYLRMPTWETYNSQWDWKRSLDDTFEDLQVRNAARLIIDLRGNEGGTDVGNAIAAHLASKPLQLEGYRRLVRYRSVPEWLRPYLHTWDKSFFDWGAAAVPFDKHFYRLTDRSDDGPPSTITPVTPHFSGRVIVLVDASNSSATFQFDALVRKFHLGTLLGEPTGGNKRGINGGAFFFLSLPNSHIEVDVPLIGTFPSSEQPDSGLAPDVFVPTTQGDIARGTDPQLQAALAL